MGSGLSMTSVNKIKELASAREYSLALEIIDSQDLTKSLNPQFIRLCGEVYIANKRYEDARRVLVMAHKMAPEAKRVIFTLTELYLKMGFKELADFYYRLYEFDAEPSLPQTNQLRYIYGKAQECTLEELETLLFPVYSDNMDYDWSYELFLLLVVQGKEKAARDIYEDYSATYKNETNVSVMREVLDNPDMAHELFYIYPKIANEDDDPALEELRLEERQLMEADEIRMNPKEAEIQIVFDDDETNFGSKLKYKRFMKKQEKESRKADGDSLEQSDEQVEEQGLEQSEKVTEVNVDATSEEVSDIEMDEQEEQQIGKKTNIIKKLFFKKRKDEVDEESEAVESEDTGEEVETVTQGENDETEVAIEVTEDSTEDSIEVDTAAEEESEQEDVESTESTESVGDSGMQELYNKKKISISSDFDEESFLSDDDSKSKDYSNPFEQMSHQNNLSQEVAQKSGFMFEEIELSPEDDEELEIDDFDVDDIGGFDDINVEDNDKSESEYEETEEVEETYEEEVAESEPEPEYEEIEEVEETYEEEVAESEPEPEYEETEEVEETYEEEVAEPEPEYEETEEVEETYEEEVAESELEPEYEEIEEVIETQEKDDVVDDRYNMFSDFKEKKNLDFPVFKTNLFPEYDKEVIEVENNFNEIMTEAQSKIQENLMKEEQMQREAEALLASLGIDLSSVKATVSSGDSVQNLPNQDKKQQVAQNNVVTSYENTPSDKVEQVTEIIEEPVNTYSPSRDELKASLKIDSVKKSILKQLKEYR